MSEEKKNTGLGHDDDGNIDDKRIAGWILLVAVLGLSALGIVKESSVAIELVKVLIWPAGAMLGISVTEKFGKKA